VRGLAHGLKGRRALVGTAVGNWDRLDERGAVPAPVGSVGRDGAVDALGPAQLLRDLLGARVAFDQDLVRQQRALADAGVLESDQAFLGVTLLGERVGVVDAEPKVGGSEHQCGEQGQARPGRQPAVARDPFCPARPAAARLVVASPVRPVEPRAELGEHQEGRRCCLGKTTAKRQL
jgi:hypothetical protein